MRRRNELACVRLGGGGRSAAARGGDEVRREGSLFNQQREPGPCHFLPLAVSAGPDSNPFESLVVLREC